MSTVFLATTSAGLMRGISGQAEPVAPGHDVRTLAVDSSRPGHVFAGTRNGLHESSDAGLTWRQWGLEGLDVRSLAVSRSKPDRIYAGTKPTRVFSSTDDGKSWDELDAFRRIRSRIFWLSPAEPRLTAYVHALALSPEDPELIIAGVEAGAVVRSADGGRTWEDHRPGAMRDCHSLASHATEPGWFYEGGYGGGAFSRDGGRRWQRPAGLDRRYGWAVAADTSNPELWYVSSSPGVQAHSNHANAAIFRTRGGGWERLGGGLPNPLNAMPYALLTGPSSGHITAGLSSGELWHSDDSGNSWRLLEVRFPGIERCLVKLEDSRA